MSYPYCYWGQHVDSNPFSRQNRRNNRRWRVRLGNIGASSRPMVVFSGFYESPWPPSSGNVRDSTAALLWPSKWPSKWVHITSLFCLLLPWWPPRRYRASSCPMVASSDFQCGPEHAASCIRWCCMYRFNASAWQSKWPATETHLFVAAAIFAWRNHR